MPSLRSSVRRAPSWRRPAEGRSAPSERRAISIFRPPLARVRVDALAASTCCCALLEWCRGGPGLSISEARARQLAGLRAAACVVDDRPRPNTCLLTRDRCHSSDPRHDGAPGPRTRPEGGHPWGPERAGAGRGGPRLAEGEEGARGVAGAVGGSGGVLEDFADVVERRWRRGRSGAGRGRFLCLE